MSNSISEQSGQRAPRRLRRILAYTAGSLVVLLLLLFLFENWRGEKAWENFRAEWEAKGERFDLQSFIPPPVAYEENFATTPLLVPLLDYFRPSGPNQPVQWNNPQGNQRARALGNVFQNIGKRKAPSFGQWQSATFTDLEEWQRYFEGHTNFTFATTAGTPAQDVLAALKKFDAELDEISVASTRPHSVFPVRYQETFNALLPHLAVIKGIAQIARLRATARLAAGLKAEALDDVKLALRLAEALKGEPFLISQLVRFSIFQIAAQPIWEGLSRHDWTAEQLADLQAALSRIQVLEDYGRTIRSERAMGNVFLDDLRTGRVPGQGIFGDDDPGFLMSGSRFIPSAWYYQNQITLNHRYQAHYLSLIDAPQHRFFVQRAVQSDNNMQLEAQKPGLYDVFARMILPAMTTSAMKFAYAQTTIDLASVACALERHRLAHKEYPEQLDPLVPKFIARIPVDVINGNLLRYRREADNTFASYSVGWNESDDGGEVEIKKAGSAPDPKRGDWLWRQSDP